MRGEILQLPTAPAKVVELCSHADAAREERLSWRACLAAWLGLSVVSWGAVLAIAARLA